MEEDLVAVTTHKITDQDTSCPSKTGPEIAKTSYTDMAGKPPILGDGNTAKVNSIDEEVVTFEEDVITIRDGAIPSIQLFDRVHDQCGVYGHNQDVYGPVHDAKSGDTNGNDVHPLQVKEMISEENLFGPWMVMGNRRGLLNQVQEEIRDAVLRPKTAGVERSSKGLTGFHSAMHIVEPGASEAGSSKGNIRHPRNNMAKSVLGRVHVVQKLGKWWIRGKPRYRVLPS
ncbi:hypothetical protein V6N13_028984 [Hibiscus sabdariffa]